MRGFSRPWFVAGGWALDLYMGYVTRPHGDLEIALFREDQGELRAHLPDWHFEKVVGGQTAPWPAGERLEAPVHEIHASIRVSSQHALEFLLNERSGDEWVYRRNPSVTRALDRAIGQAGDVPYLRPEIALLYKSKSPRPVDEQDFRVVRNTLNDESRAWLVRALELCHPGHHWLETLMGRKPNR